MKFKIGDYVKIDTKRIDEIDNGLEEVAMEGLISDTACEFLRRAILAGHRFRITAVCSFGHGYELKTSRTNFPYVIGDDFLIAQ